MSVPTAPTAPPAGVPVFNPDGDLVTIPALTPEAVLQGYRSATPEEVRTELADQRYGGGLEGLKSFGEGAGSALTFGLFPELEKALGVKPEDIAGRKEAHPIAHGAGEVLGVAAPLLLTAGMDAPVAGAQAAAAGAEGAAAAARAAPGVVGALRGASEFTAPGLIAKAGQAVRGGLESALIPGAEGLTGAARAAAMEGASALGRYAPVVAQGAAEGALYTGADVMERHALNDPTLTAESAAAELGIGTLFGGALMGGGKAIGEGFSALLGKASKGLQSVSERLAAGDKATVRLMTENRGTLGELAEAAPGAIEQIQASSPATAEWIIRNAEEIGKREKEFPGLVKLLSRADPDTGQLVLDNWGQLLKDPQRRIEIGTAMQDAAQSAYDSITGALKTINTEVRPGEIEHLLNGPHAVDLPGGASALEVVLPEDALKEGRRILGRVEKTIAKMEAEPDLYDRAYTRQLQLFRDGLTADLEAGPAPADVFQRLRNLRMQLDGEIPWDRDVSGLAERKAVAELKSLRTAVKGSIVDEGVWGKAGARQAAYDTAIADYQGARKAFEKLLMDGPKGAKAVSPTKINSWLNLAADLRGKAKNTAFDEFLEAGRGFAGEMEAAGFDGAGAVRQAVEAAAQQAEGVRQKAVVTQIVKMLQGPQILSSGPAIPNLGAELAHEAVNRAANKVLPFGLTGIISGTIEKVRSPAVTIGVLNALDKLAQRTSKAMNAGVARIFEGEGAAAASGAARVLTPENYADVAGSLNHLGGDAAALADKVAQHTEHVDTHAPSTAQALTALAARGVGHLQGAFPQGPQALPLSPQHRPSRHELRPFNQTAEVAQKPLAVLDHIARGTLDPRHVQAAEAIYPRLTQEMRAQLTERLAAAKAAGTPIPRKVRLALGMFLGSDLDSSTTTATILANQRAFATAPKPMQPGAVPASGGGKAKALKMSGTFATMSQRMLSRES